jgi:hypothetical protein
MKQQTINNTIEELKHLDGLLNERIEDMSEGKPNMQAIHAYTLYRMFIEMALMHIDNAKWKGAVDSMHTLERCFNQRIEDLHNVKGVVHYRHAFIHYRSVTWDALFPMRDELNKRKSK